MIFQQIAEMANVLMTSAPPRLRVKQESHAETRRRGEGSIVQSQPMLDQPFGCGYAAL
jgi:hypothetical protein